MKDRERIDIYMEIYRAIYGEVEIERARKREIEGERDQDSEIGRYRGEKENQIERDEEK